MAASLGVRSGDLLGLLDNHVAEWALLTIEDGVNTRKTLTCFECAPGCS